MRFTAEVIAFSLLLRISARSLKGVTVALDLNIVLTDGHRDGEFTIGITIDGLVLTRAGSSVNKEHDTVDRNGGPGVADGTTHSEA